jgi:SulP family sulfate permease
MTSKIIDFSNLKRRFYWRSGRCGRLTTRPCIWCAIRNGGDSWSIWSNHGRDICSNICGTPTQASGPTGPMTVVSAALVAASIQLTGSLETALGIYFSL